MPRGKRARSPSSSWQPRQRVHSSTPESSDDERLLTVTPTPSSSARLRYRPSSSTPTFQGRRPVCSTPLTSQDPRSRKDLDQSSSASSPQRSSPHVLSKDNDGENSADDSQDDDAYENTDDTTGDDGDEDNDEDDEEGTDDDLRRDGDDRLPTPVLDNNPECPPEDFWYRPQTTSADLVAGGEAGAAARGVWGEDEDLAADDLAAAMRNLDDYEGGSDTSASDKESHGSDSESDDDVFVISAQDIREAEALARAGRREAAVQLFEKFPQPSVFDLPACNRDADDNDLVALTTAKIDVTPSLFLDYFIR
ncbi:hypothetical protein Rhopal_006038-T1 [Rhodotorula paludigena]|uniref:Uncharacterized protein n=1 Tax=Rhodotorula paludigena TaxID=86838 RepID=A0AAV5GWR5_9BASI|nr:hypothetical protein Rhopal_006038-T1 [Rhodotorula paludigena]